MVVVRAIPGGASGLQRPLALTGRYPRAVCSVTTAVPPRPVRVGEQLLYKLGRRYGEPALVDRQLAGRVVGDHIDTAVPRILIRVDEFPHYQAWDEPDRFGTSKFERFHEIMAGAGAPYLIAVLPRVSHAPLSPMGTGSRPLKDEEVAVLRRLAGERVCFALHGHDHRTRFASARRHSELCGLDRVQTERLLDQGLAELAGHGIEPKVFVPPFNRFDARQFGWLARRFAVVCGGPESIGLMGFQRTPQWRGEAVYLPSYAPFYGRAAELLKALPQALGRTRGNIWLPIVLHWGWEAEAGWGELERLADLLAPYATPWEHFYAAIERDRASEVSGGAAVVQAGARRGALGGGR